MGLFGEAPTLLGSGQLHSAMPRKKCFLQDCGFIRQNRSSTTKRLEQLFILDMIGASVSSDKHKLKRGEAAYCIAVVATAFSMIATGVLAKTDQIMAGLCQCLAIALVALCPIGIVMELLYGIRRLQSVVLLCILLTGGWSVIVVRYNPHLLPSFGRL